MIGGNFVQRDKYSSVLIVGRPFNFSELNIKPGTCGEYQMGRGNVKLIRLANHPIRARAFIFAREKTLSNMVRIANAVQVTLWLSLTNPQLSMSWFKFLNLSVNRYKSMSLSLSFFVFLCLSLSFDEIKVWLTHWQGHLLSCPGQLKRVKDTILLVSLSIDLIDFNKQFVYDVPVQLKAVCRRKSLSERDYQYLDFWV